MRNNWMLAKIRYEKTCQDGKNRKVSELYLVDELSFTEAEARVIEETKCFISGDMQVSAIKYENISELFSSGEEKDDKYYKIKIAITTVSEKGKERKNNLYILVQSDNTKNAEKKLHEGMKGTMSDYTVLEVKETDIVDVFPYVLEGQNDETR